MKKKNVDSEKVKLILKKCLDIFCYIVTALAITLGIAMGVNSCSGSNEPERIDSRKVDITKSLGFSLVSPDYDDYYVYENRYDSGDSEQNFDGVRAFFDVPGENSPVARDAVYKRFFPSKPVYLLSSVTNDYELISSFTFTFVDYQLNSSITQFEYCLQSVTLYSSAEIYEGSPSHYWTPLYKVNSYALNDVYHFTSVRIALSEGDFSDDEKFLCVFKKAYNQDFTFNASFNYNAPSSLQYNAVYMGQIPDSWWTYGSQDLGVAYKDYDIGWFSSNGKLFNKIRWYCLAGTGVSVVIDDKIVTLEYAGNWVYTMMYYVNTWSNEAVVVNTRDSIPYDDGNNRYFANSSTWQVPAYRRIRILQTPTQSTIDLLGSFNNNNVYDVGGLTVGGYFPDVFTLVGSAFTGILPILTLQILPSVTIGTLLFVPLVAILVFAIIRIIKK